MPKTPQKSNAFSPLRGKMPLVLLAPAFKLVECVCELFVPIMVSLIVDEALTETGSHYLDGPYAFSLVAAIFGLALLGFGCTMVTQFVSSKVSSVFAFDLRMLLIKKISSLSNSELENFGKSRILNLTGSDALSVQNGVLMFMRLLARAPFLIIGSIVASFILSPIGGLYVLIAFLCCVASALLVIAFTPRQYGKLQKELDVLASKGEDALVGRRLIRGFQIQEQEKERFSESNENYRKRAMVLAKISSLTNPLTFAFANMGVLLVLFAAGINGPSNMPFSTGVAIALTNYLTQSLVAFLQFTRLVSTVTKASVSKKRIDSFLAVEPVLKEGELKEIEKGEEAFSLSSVSMGFGGEEKVLEDISFSIRKGEKVGLFGATGSGKTVLLRLLSRDYDPIEGEVRLFSHPIKDYSFSALRGEIAYTGASSGFFKGTIRENLTLGLPRSEEEIRESLRKASADSFVYDYEDGIDHEVSEKGSNFSGGQKQRLLLARAFLSNRDIQIYDDALSALDAKTEASVRKALFEDNEKTILFVSQRVSSFSTCDKVIVLNEGKVFAMGTHEELLSSCDFYKQVYELQRKEV